MMCHKKQCRTSPTITDLCYAASGAHRRPSQAHRRGRLPAPP
jgi:hypothetical protein